LIEQVCHTSEGSDDDVTVKCAPQSVQRVTRPVYQDDKSIFRAPSTLSRHDFGCLALLETGMKTLFKANLLLRAIASTQSV